jgi:hypothetical protein
MSHERPRRSRSIGAFRRRPLPSSVPGWVSTWREVEESEISDLLLWMLSARRCGRVQCAGASASSDARMRSSLPLIAGGPCHDGPRSPDLVRTPGCCVYPIGYQPGQCRPRTVQRRLHSTSRRIACESRRIMPPETVPARSARTTSARRRSSASSVSSRGLSPLPRTRRFSRLPTSEPRRAVSRRCAPDRIWWVATGSGNSSSRRGAAPNPVAAPASCSSRGSPGWARPGSSKSYGRGARVRARGWGRRGRTRPRAISVMASSRHGSGHPASTSG